MGVAKAVYFIVIVHLKLSPFSSTPETLDFLLD